MLQTFIIRNLSLDHCVTLQKNMVLEPRDSMQQQKQIPRVYDSVGAQKARVK